MYHNRPPVQLSRYSSSPAGFFLSSPVDSVLAGDADFTPLLLAGDSSSSESTRNTAPDHAYVVACAEGGGESAPPPPQSLVRQQSSPTEFLSHHVMIDTVGSGVGYGHQLLGMGGPICHLSSRQDSLFSIPELSSTDEYPNINPNDAPYNTNSNLDMPTWDNSHSFGCATPTSKYAKISHDDVMATMEGIDSQVLVQLNLPAGTPIDVTAMEKLLQMQQDAAPCTVRAKRGCATHPRSIAERLRRTKISEKLKRLQELVAPNMDKQTNTADMLDLAVQHIRVLKSQIQTLQQECGGCTCMRNQDIHSSE